MRLRNKKIFRRKNIGKKYHVTSQSKSGNFHLKIKSVCRKVRMMEKGWKWRDELLLFVRIEFGTRSEFVGRINDGVI